MSSFRKFLYLLLLLPLMPGPRALAAQTNPALDPQAFVREVVRIELQAAAHPQPRWMYRLKKTSASGTKVTRIVETQQGLIAHLLEINGNPLDTLTQRNETHRLAELLRDPQQWRKKLARQERDRTRVLNIVRALPDAFLYSYEGSGRGAYGEEVRLKFVPNPKYSPDSLETEILKRMEGALLVARDQKRLVHLQGRLNSDTALGLGVVGKFSKGGALDIEQDQIAPGSWELTHLKILAKGRALFHPINVSVEEFATEFQPISSNLTIAEAIDLLLARDPD